MFSLWRLFAPRKRDNFLQSFFYFFVVNVYLHSFSSFFNSSHHILGSSTHRFGVLFQRLSFPSIMLTKCVGNFKIVADHNWRHIRRPKPRRQSSHFFLLLSGNLISFSNLSWNDLFIEKKWGLLMSDVRGYGGEIYMEATGRASQ